MATKGKELSELGSILSVSANTANIDGSLIVANSVTIGNSTVNTTFTATSINANTVGGNTASDLRLYADDKAANAYSNAVTYADNKVANLVNNAPTILDTLVELSNAIGNDANFFTTVTNNVANAYTNATTFASNATNISSGTLNTARLPATVNVSTLVNVGTDVNINTSAIFIGNSSVNTIVSAATITLNGVNVNTAISGNAATAYTNAAAYADVAAGTAYANAVSYANTIAGTAYSNAATYADNKAANAYSNAIAYSANATNITSGTLTANVLPTSGVTANTYGNSSAIPVITVDATGRITSATVNAVAGVTSFAYTEANNTFVISTGAGTTFAANIGTANATHTGVLKVLDSVANTNTTIAAAVSSVKTAYDAAIAANTSAASAYSNAVSYAGTIAATAYTNATSYAASIAGTAYSNGVTYTDNKAANAYSNATTFASNASNISSGTLGEARLPYRMDQNVRTIDNVTFHDAVISGNLTVNGTTVTINATELAIEDNMIYLNEGAQGANVNPDLGFAGAYNDGTYRHAGFFRDASDGVWKVYDQYLPEPDASPFIDTGNTSFRIANFQANVVTAASFSGNGASVTSVNAATVGGNTAGTLRSYSDSAAATAYSNAISVASSSAATAYSNAVSYFTTNYTASDVLTKIKTVDGAGSGLDADTVDGYDASSFALKTDPEFTNDITTSSGQGRFGGWYQGTGYTGAALEVGVSSGEGQVLAYNRGTSSYLNMNFAATDFEFSGQSSGYAHINTSFRAPIFYDSVSTSYYVDPGTSSRLYGHLSFGIAGNGSNVNGRWLSIEGNADGDGEGSSRIFFSEHNSTTGSMDSFGMSIGYRGGSTSIVGSSGNTWTGLSAIGNGEWGLWGHDGSATGSLAMFGPRSGSYVTATGSFRAPIFYDSANTSFYVDPDSSSNIGSLTTNSGYNLQTSSASSVYTQINATDVAANYAYIQLTTQSGSGYLIRNRTTGNSVTDKSLYLYNEAGPIEFVPSANISVRATLSTTGMTIAGSTVWHSGNDGSGSGLDADTLDGNNSSAFLGASSYAAGVAVEDSRASATTPQTINMGVKFDFKQNSTEGLSDGGTYFGEMTFRQYGSGTDFTGGRSHQLGFTDNDNVWHRSGTSTSWGSWYKLWHSNNDGSGSGLDADLWDGYQFSDYLNQAVKTNSTPTFYQQTLSGVHLGGYGILKILSGDDSLVSISTTTNATAGLRLQNNTADVMFVGKKSGSSNFVVDHGFQQTGEEFIVDTSGHAYATGSFRAPIFYDSANTSFYVDPASTSNLSALNVGGSAVWTSGNDGAGSGLDADLLDGSGWTSGQTVSFGSATFTVSGYPIAAFNNTNSANYGLVEFTQSGSHKAWIGMGGTGMSFGTGAAYDTDGFSINADGAGAFTISNRGASKWIRLATGTESTSNFYTLNVRNGDVIVNQDAISYSSMDNTPVVGSTTTNRLHVNGSIQLTNNNDAIVFGRGTATFLKDEELGFGWGGGWYMIDGDYLRVRNNKAVYSTGDVYAARYYDSANTSFYVDPASTSNLSALNVAGTSAFTGFVGIGGSFGSDDGGWGARLNVGGAPHARIDARCTNDGIFTTMFSHQGQNRGYIGTTSNHRLAIGVNFTEVQSVYSGYSESIGSYRAPIFYDSANTSFYVDPASTSNLSALNVGGSAVWTSGNDGSGSGLDADLLDGLNVHNTQGTQSSANQILRTQGDGYTMLGWINTPSGDSGIATRLTKIYSSYDDYIRYSSLTDFKVHMSLSAKNNYSRRIDYTSDSNYHVGSFGHGGYGANETFHGGSGFFDIWSGTNFPSGTSHIHGFNALHYTTNSLGSTGGNAYGLQVAGQYDQAGTLFTRTCNGGSFSSWHKIWSAANDGSGSGLDADLWDGYNFSDYLNQAVRSDSNPTFGIVNLSGSLRNNGSVSDNDSFGIYYDSSASTAYAIYREDAPWSGDHADLRVAFHTGIKFGGNPSYGGKRFYTDYDMSTLVFQVNGSSNYLYKYYWMYTNTSGFYSDTNSAHFNPNTSSSYGSWVVQGSRNGWRGIHIYDGGSTPHLMFDGSSNGGIYYETGGRWASYYHYGNVCQSINTSTSSSSYGLYVSGAIYSTSNITAYSDVRKKENIVTVDNALDKVNKLRGVYYNKIDDEKKTRQIGVIAQEVNEVLPEVVTYAEDVDEYGVTYGNLAGLFIEAFKEQTKIINSLKQKIEELEAKLEKK